MNDFLVIENVDTEALDEQRLQLAASLLDPEVCKVLGEKRKEALEGLLNMLDSWSDDRAEFFEPPIDWQPVEPIIEMLGSASWTWVRNRRCKYVHLFVDTRDMRCLLRDRNQLRISMEDLRKQYTGKEDE